MDYDLNLRGNKFQKEQQKRKQIAREKATKENQIQQQVLQKQRELEETQRAFRVEQLDKKEKQEENRLQEERKTGGIKYKETLKAYPTFNDGDRITLPPSALEQLNPQEALNCEPLTFELTNCDGRDVSTCAGVLEFVAEEGYVGLPPKVASSLLKKAQSIDLGNIQVKYIRLEMGKSIKLQPLREGLGDREVDIKHLLERSLKNHVTLMEDDVFFIRLGGETFEFGVREVKPELQARILNTDLKVDILLSEFEENAIKEQEAQLQREKEETERKQHRDQERKKRISIKRECIPLEPSPDFEGAIVFQLRMPDGKKIARRFRATDLMQSLFYFIDCQNELLEDKYRLVSNYPRRQFTFENDSKRNFTELGFSSRLEALFVEEIKDETSVESSAYNTSQADVGLIPDICPRWKIAREMLELNIDKDLANDGSTPIHAMEPLLPSSSVSELGKWNSQLKELSAMGFNNMELNIKLLDRYQGRLLRVTNYLSEM